MPSSRIIRGQNVPPAKLERARQLRREMTPQEAILWKHLRGDRLGYHFRRQQVIDGFIVDFYCHAAALIIEIDGAIHQQQADYDHERDAVLSARGLRIVRFTNDEIQNNLNHVLQQITALCADPKP